MMDYAALTKRDVAVGQSDVHDDSIVFRFGENGEMVVRFPTVAVIGRIAHWNGCYYEASIKEIHKLSASFAREAGNG